MKEVFTMYDCVFTKLLSIQCFFLVFEIISYLEVNISVKVIIEFLNTL